MYFFKKNKLIESYCQFIDNIILLMIMILFWISHIGGLYDTDDQKIILWILSISNTKIYKRIQLSDKKYHEWKMRLESFMVLKSSKYFLKDLIVLAFWDYIEIEISRQNFVCEPIHEKENICSTFFFFLALESYR